MTSPANMPGTAAGPTNEDSASPGAQLSPAARWRAYTVAVAVAALTILDMNKVNVALPSIESALGAGPTELQLIVSGYVLTFGLCLVPAGRWGDVRSRRALFLVGLSLFLVSSLACALAPSGTFLLVARLVQGVAAGIQMPQVLGLVQELFQGPDRGRAFGVFGATIGVATAIGPTLGGLLIAVGGDSDSWRLIFWFNIPLTVIVIVLAALLLPRTRATVAGRVDMDPVGVVLFGAAVVLFLLPFLFTTGSPSDDPRRWWLLVGSALLIAAFIAWDRIYASRGRQPLLPPGISRIGTFRNGVLVSSAYLAAMPTTFLLGTLYLQGGLGFYFPKATDLSIHTEAHLRAVEDELNRRPRKVLDGRSPAAVFPTLIASITSPVLRR